MSAHDSVNLNPVDDDFDEFDDGPIGNHEHNGNHLDSSRTPSSSMTKDRDDNMKGDKKRSRLDRLLRRSKKVQRPRVYYTYPELDSSLSEELIRSEQELGYRTKVEKKRLNLYDRIRHKIFLFMNVPSSSIPAAIFAGISLIIIVLAVVSFIIESFPRFQNDPDAQTAFFLTETFFVAFFTIEYSIRLCVDPHPVKFVYQPLNIVDLVAILPYFIELILRIAGITTFLTDGLLVVRVIRVARVFRMFKLGRYTEIFIVVMKAFVGSIDALLLLVFFLVIGLILFASLEYFAEQTQEEFNSTLVRWVYTFPEEDLVEDRVSPFQSIPHTVWWVIVTMTTVGYGDIAPRTPLGKTVAALTMLSGLLILAFPVGVLGAKFSEAYELETKLLKQRNLLREMRKDVVLERLEELKNQVVQMETHLETLEPLVGELKHRYSEAKRLLESAQRAFPNRARYLKHAEMDDMATQP